MGTITGTTILNQAAQVLFDINGVEWNRLELLEWLSEGQRRIAFAAPAESRALIVFQMVAGPLQHLTTPTGVTPAYDFRQVLAGSCNMGTNGTTRGRALRKVSRKLLDDFNPNWMTTTPTVAVENFMWDKDLPTQFWVYPPSDGTGYIEMEAAVTPQDLATESATITLGDHWQPALVDYILARAGEKTTDYSPGMAFSKSHWEAFAATVEAFAGVRLAYDLDATPAQPRQEADA